MADIENKRQAINSTVIEMGAMTVNPLTTIPNLPTQNSSSVMDGEVVKWGEDNRFPYYLSSLLQVSPTHAAIIDYKANQIAGRDVEITGEVSPSGLQLTKRQYRKLFKNISSDLAVYEAIPFQLITNATGQVITIAPLPTDSIRSGDYKNGVIQNYYYSQNWADTNVQPTKLTAWNPNKRGGKKGKFLAYLRQPKSGQYFYTVPSYFSAWRWVDLESTIGEFHKNNIDNGFFPSVIIEFFGQEPTAEEKAVFENEFKNKFTGAGSSKVVLKWNSDPEDAAKITTFQPANLPDYFGNLMEEISSKIITSHKISPLLVGIKLKGTTGLGSNSEEIQASFALYQSSTIQPIQDMIIDFIEEIHDYNGDDVKIEVLPNIPDFSYEAVKGKRNDLPQEEPTI